MIAHLILLTLSSSAFAGDKDFPQEITLVTPGSTLVLGSDKKIISGKTWLFPESYYLTALQKAQKLEICEPALIRLRDDYSSLLSESDKQSSLCTSKLLESHNREQDLIRRAVDLESQNAELKRKLSSARKSSLTAWTVTGSLLLGAGTTVYFTLR